MRRPGRRRFLAACLILSVFFTVVFTVGFATCLESACATWHKAVNTLAFLGAWTFLVMALIAALIGWVKRS